MKAGKKVRALYDILGVESNATADEIKTAYRTLAMKYHPDRNDGIDATEFTEATKAYKILSDPEKREEYDKTGYTKDNIHDTMEVAVEILQNWFRNCLNDDDALKNDVIHRLRAMGESNIGQCKQRIVLTNKKIKKLRKVIKRLKYTGNSSADYLSLVIQDIINTLTRNMTQANYQISVIKLIFQMLGFYEYDYNLDPDEDENLTEQQPLGNVFDFARKATDL